MSARKPPSRLDRAKRDLRASVKAEMRERMAAHRNVVKCDGATYEVNPSGQLALYLADAEGRAAAAEWLLREACHDVSALCWSRPYRRLLLDRESRKEVRYYRTKLRRAVREDGAPFIRLITPKEAG